ncbi:hypothetical protein BBD40_27430 [Paenibacillus ihbetae]|uniref:Gram-positive cocci surface proteins LPxTG domain-containing protein n=1 Tax=Paenibacillus ihbetae TaxID=1870820 RepID=A0ABX3JR97_9BACL|nr:isopeptide-forming domain-containing fimbrial protein [Paenibacillus ihbetae]OOC59354.1 hypothetical protein BBD40_27430 [Paenibacillus ihbetae]
MNRTSIFSRRLKCLAAVFIILFGQLLPLYPQQAEAAADNWLNFKFDEFSQNTVNQFTLDGHATIAQGQNFIRLTQPTTLQSGAAFNNTALCPRDNYSFSTAFSFKMSNPSAQGASDGLTFTLQTGTTSQNMNGGGLGYYGISPSFAVKYDTFKNDVYKDPSSNYVGLAVNGDVVNQAGWYTDLDSTSFKLSDGTQYYTWIDYNSSTRNVQVHLGTSPDRVNASKVLDVNGIDLGSIFNGQSIHAGFTGSTGSPNYETHDIHSWYFVNAYAPIDTLDPNNTYKVNEAPVVPGDSKVTAVNTPVSGQVIGADPDGDPLTYAKGATDPQNGTVTVNADGTWSYTPAQDFIGTDSFTVIANDGKCATAEATINVEVSDSVPPTTPQPPNTCGVKVALINGSFEEPPGPGSMNGTFGYYEDEVPGWKTTDDTGGVKWIEIWDYAEGYPDPYVKQQPAPVHGNRYAELNASGNGMLYQDVETTPGQTIYWRLSHKGLYGEDTMQLRIGPATADPYDTSVIEQMTDGNTAWGTYTGSYTVPAGQTMTRFGFEAVSTSNGSIGHGNHLDNIFLGTEPCVIAEKSVSPAGDVFEGDELTYEVTVKNEGGDVAANAVFEDAIPAGTEYVPGSMKMVSGTNAVDLTDADDTDAGHFDGSKVIIRLGNLQNTNDLPEGITLQFKVKALSSHAGNTVANKAQVKYKSLLKNEDQSLDTNEVTNNVVERPDPPDACAAPVALINGSFEEGPERGSYDPVNSPFMFYQDEVPGWMTTDSGNGANVHLIEIWDYAQGYPDPEVKQQPAPVDGNRYAELNAVENGMLYQDVPTTPGQTIYWRLSHKGRYGVDTMQVRIGPATDNPYDTVPQRQMSSGNTAWETYTGTYTVPAGQTMTRFGFEAVSTSSGSIGYGNHLDNIFLGTEPCVIAEKSVSPAGDVFEGDELTYEVTVKNEGGDVAANAVFEDAIPAGTEYVPGSMKMVSGTNAVDLTDADDTDAGHFDGSKVIIRLGNLQNTNDLPEGITLQFKVKALSSHVGQTVTNKAAVDYKNLLTDNDETTESNETTSQIIEREVVNACTRPVALINGSFEEPAYTPGDPKTPTGPGYTFPQDENVPGWHTTDSTGRYDIFVKSLMEEPGTPAGNKHEVIHGEQFAEINSFENATLYQDVETTPGQTIYWRLAHKGRFGVDTMAVNIGSGNTAPENLPTVRTMSTDKDAWKYYSGTYTVPAGQTVTRFGFEAIASANGNITGGNFIDDVFLGTEPCVVAEKSVSPAGQAFVGDEITYEVNIKNAGGDVAANTVFEDAIPAGTEYVPGSMKIVSGTNASDLTDAVDQDAGHFDGSKVIIRLGEVPNTNDLPNGITVQFKVKALSDHAGDSVSNKANVGYKNLLTNEDKTTPSNEVTTSVEYKEPKLEANKTAELLEKAAGNTDATHPEVGDTLLYTIQTHNTIEDSLVTNLTISDVIPAGLEYVAGTLKVNDVQVTDDQDGDSGHFANGKVLAQFGDVTDTKWYKVSFQVKVLPGQAGNDIRNVAEVDGDNVTTPSTPEEVVEVYPREAALESTKTSELLEKAAGNTDAAHPEVGDTLQYTIQTRNTVTDSQVTNLTISDVIPAGLEYVAGTLKVDDVQVTDDQDSDNGHFVNGKVLAQFGDVTDTNWHNVSFHVKVLPGQAGKDIRNVAEVDGDNVTTPSTPEEVVEVYPRENVLESTKTAELFEKAAGNTDAAHPEVGDTLLYTIQTHNKIEDSLVTNLTISDEIPAGLEYVTGTLKVDDAAVTDDQDGDAGHFANGKVFAKFGDVTDTKPRKVTFQVKVLPGQAGKDIRNVAVVDSDNITTPSTPEEVVEVYPRETALESTKTAELFEKAAGNTDAAHPEIGDTLLYTIQTRNTASDSRVTNLRITDEIPTGLEYVPGTLKVNDVQVTDDPDGDKGHFANGKIFAGFGDVTDTEWRKVTFQVKVLPGQAGKDIINIAAVEGDNVGTPDRPRNEVEVYPRNPQIETDKSVANTVSKATYEVGDTITYTIRVRGVVNDTYLENLTITDTLPADLEYVPGSLKVDGVAVTDPKDDDAGHSVTGDVYGSFGNVDDTDWHTLEFQAIILPGQGGLVIENTARVTGDNIDQPGEPTEKMVVEPEPPVEPPVEPPIDPPTDPVNPPVDPDPPVTPPVTPPAPVMESRKTSRDLSGGIIGVGDTLEYTISARNTVAGSYVSNLVIADILPEGLTYVAGSLKVEGVSVTDNVDGDNGQYVNGKVSGNFGRITDTEWHTITFQATVKATQAGKSIVNIGEVTGDNVTTPEKPSNVIEVTDSGNNDGNTTNPGGSGDPDGDSNEDPNGNSNEDTDGDSNGNPDEDSNGDADGDSNTGAQTPDDQNDSTLGESDSAPQNPAQSGDQAANEPNGNKLPNTATTMYSYMVAGAMMLLAGSLLLRRRKKA